MESEFSGDMHICTLHVCPKYITSFKNQQINRYKKSTNQQIQKIKKIDKSKKLIQMFFLIRDNHS